MALLDCRPDDRACRLERVEDQARDHQLPGGRGETVASDRKGGDRPGQVHDADVAPRVTALAHPERGSNRAHATRGEDETEVAGGGVELVLDHVGQQHFARAQEDQVSRGRGHECPPQPHTLADERQALAHGRAVRDMLRDLQLPWPQREHRQRRGAEGGRVDGEREPRARRDEPAAEQRPDEPESDRADELVERVGGGKILRGQQVRHDRLERRDEEGRAAPIEGHERDELPEFEGPREHQRRQARDRCRTHDVGPEHQQSPVVAVAQNSAEQQKGHRRDRHADSHNRERRGRVPEHVGLPGDRDQENPVTDERNGHAGPEHAEVAVP